MTDSLAISNNILRRAFNEGIEISPMKLQKLLYFLYARYLHVSQGEHLLSSRFEVWKYGPVLSEVYHYFSDYRAKPIKKYAQVDGEAFALNEIRNPLFKEALDTTWDKWKSYSAQQLSAITHFADSAWDKADKRGDRFLNDNEVRTDGEVFFE
ncbi:MAG: DUF4065 domain-containing protein [Defluviitaleaceae bacterium]|nr:DUF4065 domain-containing protein [Defluviitaleaceae bacterium]